MSANDAFTICKTTTGDVWIGTTAGLLKYNRSSDDFTRIAELKSMFTYDILEDFKLCAVPAEFLRRILDLFSTFFSIRLFLQKKAYESRPAVGPRRRYSRTPGAAPGKKNVRKSFLIHGFLYFSVCPEPDPHQRQ